MACGPQFEDAYYISLAPLDNDQGKIGSRNSNTSDSLLLSLLFIYLFSLELHCIALQTTTSNTDTTVNNGQQSGPGLTCYYPGTYIEIPVHFSSFQGNSPEGIHWPDFACPACFRDVVIFHGNFYYNHRNGEKRGSSLKREGKQNTFSGIFHYKEYHKEGNDYQNSQDHFQEGEQLSYKKNMRDKLLSTYCAHHPGSFLSQCFANLFYYLC